VVVELVMTEIFQVVVEIHLLLVQHKELLVAEVLVIVVVRVHLEVLI
tara:strand:- start:373 stop:513 length:141 start_codon:yes stop_codon:yes gene_type:complete